MLKQIFIPYWKWECYKNNMYNKICINDEIIKEKICYDFMNNTKEFSFYMEKVIFSWKNTMKHHLSNKNINRKAFVGQCACYYHLQIPEYITRKIWKKLNKKKFILANNEAIKNIKKWEYNQKLKITYNCGSQDVIKMGYQMKLQFK